MVTGNYNESYKEDLIIRSVHLYYGQLYIISKQRYSMP